MSSEASVCVVCLLISPLRHLSSPISSEFLVSSVLAQLGAIAMHGPRVRRYLWPQWCHRLSFGLFVHAAYRHVLSLSLALSLSRPGTERPGVLGPVRRPPPSSRIRASDIKKLYGLSQEDAIALAAHAAA